MIKRILNARATVSASWGPCVGQSSESRSAKPMMNRLLRRARTLVHWSLVQAKKGLSQRQQNHLLIFYAMRPCGIGWTLKATLGPHFQPWDSTFGYQQHLGRSHSLEPLLLCSLSNKQPEKAKVTVISHYLAQKTKLKTTKFERNKQAGRQATILLLRLMF